MQKTFTDTNENIIPYSGQEITWRVSAYAVITKGNKVLLKREGDGSRFDFPGGGVEPEEYLVEGLAREVAEEVGAKVKIGSQITMMESWFYLHEPQAYHHTLRFYYRAELVGDIGTPTDTKITQIKWFDWSEINDEEFQDDVRYMNDYLHPRKDWREKFEANLSEDDDEEDGFEI